MFNFNCSHCASSFQARSKLEAHLLANHKCRLCDKEFKDKHALKEHKKSCECHQLLLFRCEDCGKTNAHKGHHQKHVETCRVKKTIFQCKVCKKDFTNERNRKMHEQNHEQLVQLPCHQCEKQYNSEESLSKHLQRYHQDLECNWCGLKVSSKTNLDKHMDRKHKLENGGVIMSDEKKT